jgi:hypothetical protein
MKSVLKKRAIKLDAKRGAGLRALEAGCPQCCPQKRWTGCGNAATNREPSLAARWHRP